MNIKNFGCTPIYNKEFIQRGINDVILWDVFPIENGEELRIIFDSVNAQYRQGIWMYTDMGIEIEGQHCPSVELWYDTAPKEVLCKCYTKNGKMSVYNTFFYKGQRMSQAAGSGMRISENGNSRIYHCNDFEYETSFDKLIFHIDRIK